ncbi:Zinc finger MYM-type protein 1 [Eumeta japonica]|uniref:Zinc finger MYM-type protein 1 n=1 Tax=Eumeta variegata TaxID=151549 RepID=A0A4C1TNX5_EUMVA|nr:Zinc finger MYM-type protein 1 [Eumeta japonica]
MAQHIQNHANKGKGHTSYLSKTICEEFIHLIASSILNQIICEIKRCKYYSVSLDSTPDISHVDQLTLIVRYVLPSGPVERSVKFLDMEGHTAEQLAQSLLDFLSESGIDIKDCRGQSYDNASNMSGNTPAYKPELRK